jgi:hypothetical protein
MNAKVKTNAKSASNSGAQKKPGAANSNVKVPKEQKKKLRQKAKFANNPISILCTNGKEILTSSSVARDSQKSRTEIYSDPFMHVAWNPKKARNIIDKNSSFAKKFGDLSSF